MTRALREAGAAHPLQRDCPQVGRLTAGSGTSRRRAPHISRGCSWRAAVEVDIEVPVSGPYAHSTGSAITRPGAIRAPSTGWGLSEGCGDSGVPLCITWQRNQGPFHGPATTET